MGRKRKPTLKEQAVANVIKGVHGDPPEPFEWVLSRFYMLSKNIGVSSQSDKAKEALELAQWLTPYMVPRKRAVDVTLKANERVTVSIGGDEEFDYTEDYDDPENADVSDVIPDG